MFAAMLSGKACLPGLQADIAELELQLDLQSLLKGAQGFVGGWLLSLHLWPSKGWMCVAAQLPAPGPFVYLHSTVLLMQNLFLCWWHNLNIPLQLKGRMMALMDLQFDIHEKGQGCILHLLIMTLVVKVSLSSLEMVVWRPPLFGLQREA